VFLVVQTDSPANLLNDTDFRYGTPLWLIRWGLVKETPPGAA
jgi:hypothetical protein